MKKLIIFDLDGTLINSAPDLSISINYMLEQIGYKVVDHKLIHSWVGNGAQTLVKRALVGKRDIEGESVDEALFQNALDIFLDYYAENLCESTVCYKNVKESLEMLYKGDFTLSIVTNKPYSFVKPILDGLNIAKYFDEYLGADSLERKKPDPLPLQYMCEKYGVAVEDAIMIGDSKNDIVAAHAINMESIGVTYGYNYGEDIGIYNPTYRVDDFSEIIDIINGDM